MQVIYFSINIENILKKEFCLKRINGLNDISYEVSAEELSILKPKKVIDVILDTYMLVILEGTLKSSSCFRSRFFSNLKPIVNIYQLLIFNIKVQMPNKQIIDKRGNKLIENSCLEKRELDNAMAWFSTLGGAFSALGDTFEYCAVMAGKISEQQFKLGLRLGDPNLVARCKLYMALSLIQQKKFNLAKILIKSQYVIAKKDYERDKKLLSMCQGIWSKWKYDKKQAKINGNIVC